eukprot:6988573-Prymnesium_polylepis.1
MQEVTTRFATTRQIRTHTTQTRREEARRQGGVRAERAHVRSRGVMGGGEEGWRCAGERQGSRA